MPTYEVTSPDGRTFEVTAPEGASQQEVLAYAQSNFQKLAPKETLGGNLKELAKGIVPGGIGLLETAGIGASALLPEEYEKPTREFIKGAAEAGRKPFEAAPGYEESVGRKLGEGIGSTLPFFAMGPAGVAGRLGAGALGVAAGAGEARQGAEAKGATAEERRTATQLGAPVGLLDMLAPEIGPLKNIVTTALARGGVEGATEAAQKIAQNLIAKGVYDPKQDVLAGSGEEGAYGAGVGALTSLIVDLALGRKARSVPSKPAPVTPVTPEAEKEMLVLGMNEPFVPVGLPDGSVANTPAELDAYRQQQQFGANLLAQPADVQPPAPTLALGMTQPFSPVALPDGSVALTQADLDAYKEEQFNKKYAAQPNLNTVVPAETPPQLGFSPLPGVPKITPEGTVLLNEEQEFQARVAPQRKRITTEAWQAMSPQEQADAVLEAQLATAPESIPEARPVKLTKEQQKPIFTPEETADMASAKQDLKTVNKQIEEAKQQGTDLFNRLKGRVSPKDVIDIAPKEKGNRLNMLASKSGGQRLSTMVSDGSLNEFLPPDMRITEPGQDESAGVEYIKEALRNGDTRSFDAKIALKSLQKQKEELTSMAERPKAEREANLELGQIAEEQAGYEGLSTEQLVEQAQQLGIDTGTIAEDVARQTEGMTTEQYHGAARNALISAINGAGGVQSIELASVSPVEKNKNGAFAFTSATKAEVQMEKDLSGKSIFQAAQYLIDKAPNAFYKFVGKRILEKLNRMQSEGVILNFKVAGGDRRPASLYAANGLNQMMFAKDGRPMSFSVTLNGAPIMENQNGYPSGMSYKTLMHELLHTCTQAEIKFLNYKDANHPAVREMIRLYNKVAEEYKAQRAAGKLPDFLVQFDKGHNNALSSVDEMLTWSMTDERMQKWMSQIKVGEKTLMDKIVELIRSVMGIAKPYETALDRLVRTTEQIIAIDSQTLADGVKKAGYSYGPKEGPKRMPKEQQSLFSKAAQAMMEEETKQLRLGKEEKAPTPTGAGADSMRVLESLGRANQEVEPGYAEKVRQAWDNARDNPKATAEAARSATKNWLDRLETWAFSSDAALNNKIRREVEASTLANEEKIGLLLNASLSQTVHSDAVASLFLQKGGIKYNNELHKWEGVDSKANFVELSKQLDELAAKNGLTKQQAELVAHTAFEAKRLRSMVRFNEELAQKIAEVKAEAAAKRAGSPVAASALSKEAARLKEQFKYISEEQLAMIEPGMSLFKIHPELNKVVDTWNKIRSNAVDTLVETGLWSEAEAEEMLSNADYVPFYREDQLEQNKGPKEFIRGLQVQAKEKRLKGSDRPVNDIFDNQVRWVQYSINRAVRNRSALALADTAVAVGAAEKVDPEQRKGAENVVRVWRDGKEEFFSMQDPMFIEAFTGLEAIVIPSWKWASNLANMLRQSVVMYPMFSVAQVPQDSFAAMFSSGLKPQYALRIPVLAVKEFVQTLRGKSKTHEELKNVGAVGVRDFTSAMVRMDAEIYAGLKAPPGVLGKIKYGLNHIAMSADNAVRQAVYEASMSQGLSRAEALEKAFDVFNVRRKGSSKSLALAGQLIPFFSAYLAAQNVAYKTITGRGISPTERQDAFKTLAATTASVMTLSLLYAMMNGDDDDYLKKPATVRDRLLMIPGTGGLSVPLRADLFTMPKIITEHMYLMMTDKGYEDGRKFRDSMKAALGSALLGPTAVPQAIKPLVEVGINYDFFQGRPLVGTYQQKLETERQFTDSTSELGKILGKTGLVSPIAADHLIRGMFGSAGGLIIYATNPVLHSDPLSPRPSLSDRDAIAALPGMSGFMMKSYESALKKDFYTLKEEVDKAANTMNDLKTRSPQEIEGFLGKEENLARVGLQKSVNAIGERLSNIRKAITQITNSDMSSDQKQQQIEMLRKAEEEMLKSVDVKMLRQLGKI